MSDSTNQTTIKKEKFIELFFAKTGNISLLCKAIGIHRSTYYEWISKDEEFKKKVEIEREGLIDFAESKLFNLIDDKNVTAIIFFLKTRAKDRGYIEKIEQVIMGDEFKPLKVIVTSDGNNPDNPT